MCHLQQTHQPGSFGFSPWLQTGQDHLPVRQPIGFSRIYTRCRGFPALPPLRIALPKCRRAKGIYYCYFLSPTLFLIVNPKKHCKSCPHLHPAVSNPEPSLSPSPSHLATTAVLVSMPQKPTSISNVRYPARDNTPTPNQQLEGSGDDVLGSYVSSHHTDALLSI
jgi:hypothetical protein